MAEMERTPSADAALQVGSETKKLRMLSLFRSFQRKAQAHEMQEIYLKTFGWRFPSIPDRIQEQLVTERQFQSFLLMVVSSTDEL
jgi:hypothetical protein